MKKIALIIFLMITFSCNIAYGANQIHSISMDIYVNKSGDATVKETWKCDVNEGGESYHPYFNLGNSTITNIEVKDEDGVEYKTLNNWNVNASFDEKKYKCGINKTYDGIELCWGISEYGEKTYVVSYNINKFIANLNDAQMAYWTLIPYDFSVRIQSVDITIRADEPFADTLDVWGYGAYGDYCYVADGVIKFVTENALESYEYITLLAKFPLGLFDVDNNINDSFDYYLETSQEGSTSYEDYELTFWENILMYATMVAPYLFVGVITGIVIKKKQVFQITEEDKKKIKDAPYFRDIPCKKDIFKIAYYADAVGLSKKKTDLLGAMLLSWLKDGYVTIEKRERGLIVKREEECIVFGYNIELNGFSNKTDVPANVLRHEIDMYRMMKKASGDGILEKKEFERWCANHYSEFEEWFDNTEDDVKYELENEGRIKTTGGTKLFESKKSVPTEEAISDILQIAGLKKYLKDYTLIKDREAIEVKLFEEYLVVAQVLGIADKVIKEFKDLYPELVEKSNFNSYDNINFIHVCSSAGISSASAARSAAESYSSGGGGFSSGGGGGGSFGGGGGGGGFR